jgi:CheY-like chemotaxis protein
VGGCNPGDVSHSSISEAVSEWRALRITASDGSVRLIPKAAGLKAEAIPQRRFGLISSCAEDRLDITVVFTDIQMPGSMDGLKLAAAIRRRWPPIHIVATSGMVNVSETDFCHAEAYSFRNHTVRLRLLGSSAA